MRGFAIALAFAMVVVLPASTPGQEALYEAPIQIDYDNANRFNCDPVLAFNGLHHGVFFAIEGPDDADIDLYFRLLGRDGKPSGPQIRIFGEVNADWPIVACADGHDAFLVAVSNRQAKKISILRVSKDGKLLRRAEIAEPIEYWMHGPHAGVFNGCFMQVAGDKLIVAFTDRGPLYDPQRAIMLVGPKKLNGEFAYTELPRGDLKNSSLVGMTCDTEGFLAMIGQRDKSDFSAVEKVLLLRIDFEGNVVGDPYPLADPIPSSIYMGGPVFTGKGHLFFFSEVVLPSYTYKHYTQVIDAEGETVQGPTNIGWAGSWISWSSPIWNGNNVTCIFSPGANMKLMMFAPKGTCLCNPIPFSDKPYAPGFRPVEAFTGMATTLVFTGIRQGERFHHVHMNQVGLPASVTKPEIVYYNSGAEYLDGNYRSVVWSATGCSTLKITGKGVRLRNLPPVGCELVKIKGSKLTLKITARGPGGKAVKKMILKP